MERPELTRTLAWLRDTDAHPVEKDWVPGATENERRSLSGLASVVKHLTAGGGRDWPADVQAWLERAVELPSEVAREVSAAIGESADLTLASLYADLVLGSNRRVLGTFFTPQDEVSLMLDRWSINEEAPGHVVDIGAGVGVFTASAAKRWPDAKIDAIDVNPITLGLLGARSRLSDLVDYAPNINLILDDYTSWINRSASTAPRLLLGNPPYTRWQLIPEESRKRLAKQTHDYCGARASLSSYITAVSLMNIGPQDGLCLLLPAQWLESHYARRMRQRLLDLRDRRIEIWLVKSAMFEDAIVDAVILMVGTQRPVPQPFVFAEWRGDTHERVDRNNFGADGWRAHFEASSPSQSGPTVALRDLATVRRGSATGANKFFVLRDSDLVEHGLPRDAVRPLVYRMHPFGKSIDRESFQSLGQEDRRWLFLAGPDAMESEPVRDYINWGVKHGFHAGHLCSTRLNWFDLTGDHIVPDVIISSMTRGTFHVAANDLDGSITNNLYGWTWKSDVPTEVRDAVIAWFRTEEGQMRLRTVARRQGNDLLKIEPRALANIDIPQSALPADVSRHTKPAAGSLF